MSAVQETMNDRFRRWFQGRDDAVELAEQMWTALQEWDDFYDEGKGDEDLFQWLAFGVEYQPFYAAHCNILRPAFLSLYLQWTASNELDHGDESDVCKSYMLRAGYYTFLHVMTWIIGGANWAKMCGPEIYRSYGETPKEIWEEFNA